jgi:hypothetical protein
MALITLLKLGLQPSCWPISLVARRTHKPRPRSRHLSSLQSMVLTCALALLFAGVPGHAIADQLTVFSCHTPDGGAAGTEGWSIATSGQGYMYAREGCASGGGMESEVGESPGTFPNAAQIGRVFAVAPQETITHYKLTIPESYAYHSEAGIVGQDYITASDEAGGIYDYRNLGGGRWGSHTIERTPTDAVSTLQAYASCDGEGGPCPAHTRIAQMVVSAAEITLLDESSLEATGLKGSLVSGASLTGEAEASFTASDPNGPGIYSAWLVIDGQPQTPVLLNSNDGRCVTQGQTSNGTRSFMSPQPCPRSLSASIALDTASLADGQHSLELLIDDASGNSTVAYTGQITTNNAPKVITAPGVLGSALVGSTLTGTQASFATPEGAGALSAITGQWLRCTDAEAKHCTAITGATSSSYSPQSSDVGYYLLYSSTASNHDGTTVADSQPTVVVTEPAGQVAGYGGQGTGPVGGASTAGAGGSGGSGGSGGAGDALTVNLSTPGLLGSSSPWQISLNVSAKRVRRGSTLVLSGVVSTAPRPAAGKLVNLRARRVTATGTGRRGHRHQRDFYGKWVTFDSVRTTPSGTFKTSHRFQLGGGTRLYQFQAVAPQEGGYLDSTGSSQIKTVTEQPTHKRSA